MRAAGISAGLALLLTGAALGEDAPITDPVTGMTYPLAVGSFQRVAAGQDAEGAPAAVYRKGADNLTITVSAFETSTVFAMIGMPKSRKDVDKAYCMDGIRREAQAGASDVVPGDESDASIARGWSSKDGFKNSYTVTRSEFLGGKKVAVHTDIYRFCFIENRWTVQYRVDYLPGVNPAKDVKTFMHDLAWTIGKS